MVPARHEIDTVLLGLLSDASRGQAAGYLAAAQSVLERMVTTPGLLDAANLARKPGGYGRTLLFGDDDVSVWAMVWDAGSRTPVHDHHCSCCFAMLKGELSEVSFRAVGESAALMTEETRLEAGAVRCMLPSVPNLHQMVNSGSAEAISIHIYGFDHRTSTSSVDREYRIVAQ